MWVQWVLLVIIVHVILFASSSNGNKGKPRGTARLGVLDTIKEIFILLFDSDTPNYEIAARIKEKYGDLFVVDVPCIRESMACISELNLAKKIMSSSEWLNRCWANHYLHSTTFNKPIGLLFSNGDHWKEAKRLTLKILHQLDFYRASTMEKLMAFEIAEIEETLKGKIEESNQKAVTFSPHQMFEVNTLNIVCQVIMGRRLGHDDPIVERMLSSMNKFNREFNAGYSVVDVFPWLRHIPRLTFVDSMQKSSNICYEFFRKEIKKRRQEGTYRTQPSDFTDYFLQEIDRHANDSSTHVTDECYLTVMRDMVFAGTDTTNTSLEHAILHMALNQNIQKRVQTEIDEVIGNRVPTYNDRNRMPYTQAVILEILRLATPIPVSVRSPLTDNHVNGEEMAKGSLCGINIYAIHRSEDLWQNPYTFQPERFLNDEGQVVNSDKIIPFGHGKRVCIGESVARVSLFMFFVSLMEKFTWEISKDHAPPSFKNIPGLSRCPIPYHVTVRSRTCDDGN